jgi:DNA-binding Xre family transcriptional regulator
MKHKNLGSNFDDFLEEEGLLAGAEAVAAKRVLTYQIEKVMKQERVTKTLLAKKMGTSRPAVDRLLDPRDPSVTLKTLGKVATSLGKRLKIQLA